MFPCKSVSETS